MAACGAARAQLDQLVTVIKERKISPETFATGMPNIALLYGDWAGAAAAAAANHSLLLLPTPSEELSQTFEQMRAAGCSPQRLVEVAEAALFWQGQKPDCFGGMNRGLHGLKAILGSWTAAAEAVLEIRPGALPGELVLPHFADRVVGLCQEMRADGASQQLLCQVSDMNERWIYTTNMDGLRPLKALLGSWAAAVEAATSKTRLLSLPTGAEAEEVARQLRSAGIPPEQLLQLITDHVKDELSSPTLFSSLQLLNELVGGWEAAVEAAQADMQLLRLPAASDTTLEAVQQLRDSGLSRQQLVPLVSKVYASCRQAAPEHSESDEDSEEDYSAAEEGESSDGEDWVFSDEDQSEPIIDHVDVNPVTEVQLPDTVDSGGGLPEDSFADLRRLSLLLGSWCAAAVLIDDSVLSFPPLSAEQQGIWDSLATSGLSQVQLLQLLQLLSPKPASIDGSLKALETASFLFSGDWKAAVEATLADPVLLSLPPCSEADEQIAEQLETAGYSRLQRLQLAKAIARSPQRYSNSMRVLELMLGDRSIAMGAVLEDNRLLDMPTNDDMQVVAAQLGVAGLDADQLLQLAKTAAGLYNEGKGTDISGKFRAMAERLYSGDWKAASLKFLQDKHTLGGTLWRLSSTLDDLAKQGLEITNQQGRDFVLEVVKGGSQEWEVSISASAPASQRLAAGEAALEQQGFRAVGGKASELLQKVVEGTLECFGCAGSSLFSRNKRGRKFYPKS
ncbi:hypothetical protein COHA_005318 [Chlorella ohadii]|uniref:Uncharacterized protein n=1 Tax=Chlorella ohadii TaxID=2649997 RepID=A0AAD5DNZ1_9CHLO|nr:hypothetical protein COHA_005318 [Chlorella ohadii]